MNAALIEANNLKQLCDSVHIKKLSIDFNQDKTFREFISLVNYSGQCLIGIFLTAE